MNIGDNEYAREERVVPEKKEGASDQRVYRSELTEQQERRMLYRERGQLGPGTY